MKIKLFLVLLVNCLCVYPAELFVETESFTNKGGWLVDQQFMDQMGSPYLIAHGLGTPVDNAFTLVNIPETGIYYLHVRTYNWTSPWKKGEGPGKFELQINNKRTGVTLGSSGNAWIWQNAGKIYLEKGTAKLALHDLTGFDGRCDAVFLTTNPANAIPVEGEALKKFRGKYKNSTIENVGSYDLVVVGGGVAGISAALSASRLGCKVALINDRPVLGGNNSSEVRVHLGGRINVGRYKELGNLIKEFGPTRGGNAQPEDFYEDSRKLSVVSDERNIELYLNYHVTNVTMDGKMIKSVIAENIDTGKTLLISGRNFSDCTGDGTLGYLAGADYLMGREGREEFGENIAPAKADKMTMGSSVQWYSIDNKKKCKFPEFKYGLEFTDMTCEKVNKGEWQWETGMNKDQIKDIEQIRDYGILVAYSNWSYLKNNLGDKKYDNLKLGWVAYIAGKRESRRLLGDYILKEDDILKNVFHEDASFATTWSIDLHFPDTVNKMNFPDREFKAETKHIPIQPYSIPYRCLYSRNVENLFMAGRDISVTHVALGTVRVMRTCGMMGEVVGMAAFLCKNYNVTPRLIYQKHLPELKELLKKGTGKPDISNNQNYN